MTHEPTESESSGSSRRSILKSGALLAGGAVGLPLVTGSGAATGCAFTPGYWKNHKEAWGEENRHIHFGTPSIEEGPDNNKYYYFDDWREDDGHPTVWDLLHMKPKGDKSLIMAQHFIAAILNVRNDTQSWCIRGFETRDGEYDKDHDYALLAKEFFNEYPPGSNTRHWNGYEHVKDALDAYNNGEMCVCGGD